MSIPKLKFNNLLIGNYLTILIYLVFTKKHILLLNKIINTVNNVFLNSGINKNNLNILEFQYNINYKVYQYHINQQYNN
jgi:hypothetical protein